jgi:RND family efflux transporter MFP subunit
MKLKLLAILLLVAAGGVAVFMSLGGSLPLSDASAATQYLTATASTGDVTQEVAATGTIAASDEYALGFGAAPQLTSITTSVGSGTWSVTDVDASVGQVVKKGDVLAKASTSDLEQQLVIQRTSLSSARLQEKLAKSTLDSASGTAAIRQAKSAYYNAVNARRQAQQAVNDTKAQIKQATLTAPIDGTITAVNVAPGLDSTGTAITIASTTYDVTADVVEDDISSMTIGQDATVTVGAINAAIQGKVSAIAPVSGTTGGNSVVSYPVTVTLTGAPSDLKPGMSADISIITASATNVLSIPSEALRGTTGNYSVLVVGADGTPATTPVTVGLITSSAAEIKSGLTAGEVVVTGTASQLASSGSSSNGGGGGRFVGGGIGIPGGGAFGR